MNILEYQLLHFSSLLSDFIGQINTRMNEYKYNLKGLRITSGIV